ncbi:MAG: large-conductance mechanosensitive channel protein MscL [Gammaproteobacteria bacterium]|nr:large-conductance mechanosensitive channel protein MscL [Gammaproteobacteria bacterium]
MSFISEFKEFAMRGNVIDLAVGVVIGGAFGKIVSSLVNDVVMPLIGKILGGVNFSELAVVLTPAQMGADGKEVAAAVLLRYGAFIQSIIDFALIALAVFMAIKVINRLQRKKEEAPAPAAPAEDIVLLTEIRDALRSR